ncbi:MAG: N-acetylglucosamine-6-phosphate deacetylase [Lachnospiraceae bacterium]|nr:N-acetylglucosamine-6-phosphate deacetylase [Lachnospiraceae bacterium]
MIIKNAEIFGADGRFRLGEIGISNGVFTNAVAAEDDIVYDGTDCYAIPGLIDIHFHGAMGYDICDGTLEAYDKIAKYEASVGVTAICPATLTLPTDTLEKVLTVGAEYASTYHEDGAELVGFNMEGPFISPIKKGAQNEAYILPCSAAIVERFLQASKGLVKIVGLAPEENPNFEEYIRKVQEQVKVSLAHTNADYETAMRAFDAGASHVVHLYNAMSEFTHREPGVVGATADSQGVTAEIICDGIHVHSSAVRAAYKLLGVDRMILISDSLRCTGMPDGIYELGGQDVRKIGNRCTLVENGTIAGSVSNLYECMKMAVQTFDIPLEKAILSATITPAKCIGIDNQYGSIEEGKAADLLLLRKEDLSLKYVFKRGKLIENTKVQP